MSNKNIGITKEEIAIEQDKSGYKALLHFKLHDKPTIKCYYATGTTAEEARNALIDSLIEDLNKAR